MIRWSVIIDLFEWLLTGIIALCASMAFSRSNAYGGIESLAARYPGLESWLPLILWGLVFLCGAGLVILAKSSGMFTILALIFASPSLLSFDKIDVLNIIKVDLPVSTTLTFGQALALGMSIIACYMLLNSLHIFKQSRLDLKRRGAEAREIESTDSSSHSWLIALIAAAVATALAIALLADGINKLVLPRMAEMPLNIILAGLACIILLAGYLYWLGLRKNN